MVLAMKQLCNNNYAKITIHDFDIRVRRKIIKMYTFLVPSKNLPEMTEHFWTKTLLSRGCRGKCVMNKLIRME